MTTTLDVLRMEQRLSAASSAQTKRILRRLQRAQSKLLKKDFGNDTQKQDDLLLAKGFQLLEANRNRLEASRTARAIHLYRAFFQGRPYTEVEEKNKDSSLDPIRVIVDFLPTRLDYKTYTDITEWVYSLANPTEVRAKKMEKAKIKREAYFAKRKAAAVVANETYLLTKKEA